MTEGERTDYRSLGEILRDARTSQGKSVKDLAEITKISPHAIAALEADDIDQLAGPVYARSFTRNIAESLGLDAEFLLAKLALTAPAAPVKAEEFPSPDLPRQSEPVIPQTQIPKTEESKDASTWHIENVRVTRVTAPAGRRMDRRILALAVIVVLAVLLWLLLLPRLRGDGVDGRRADAIDAIDSQASLQLPTQPIPAIADSTLIVTENELPDDTTREEIVPASSIRPTRGPATSDPAGPRKPPAEAVEPEATESQAVSAPAGGSVEQSVPATPSAREEVADSQPLPAAESEPLPEVTIDSSDSRGLASIERPGGEDPAQVSRLTLLLRAERRVEIWAAADGRQRRRRILRAGEEWTLEGADHFSVEIEDAAAVAVFFDGVRRNPPPGLSGEWLLYPTDAAN